MPPPLGTRPVPTASLGPPPCEALARKGVPKATCRRRVPSGIWIRSEVLPSCLWLQGETLGPMELHQLFLRTGKEAGSGDVKIDATASRGRTGVGGPHVFLRLPSSEGWARRAQPGRNARRASLLSGFPDASWAPSPGRHMYGATSPLGGRCDSRGRSPAWLLRTAGDSFPPGLLGWVSRTHSTQCVC